MAITLNSIMSDGDIDVVLKIDSALDCSDEEYEEYLEKLDETHLKFKPGDEPTRFVLRKDIPLKHATRIENSKMKYDIGTSSVQVQLGFMIEEVRASLKGIKNSPTITPDQQIELKFTGDGLVDEKMMAALCSRGVVQNLYAARSNYMRNVLGKVQDVKKS